MRHRQRQTKRLNVVKRKSLVSSFHFIFLFVAIFFCWLCFDAPVSLLSSVAIFSMDRSSGKTCQIAVGNGSKIKCFFIQTESLPLDACSCPSVGITPLSIAYNKHKTVRSYMQINTEKYIQISLIHLDYIHKMWKCITFYIRCSIIIDIVEFSCARLCIYAENNKRRLTNASRKYPNTFEIKFSPFLYIACECIFSVVCCHEIACELRDIAPPQIHAQPVLMAQCNSKSTRNDPNTTLRSLGGNNNELFVHCTFTYNFRVERMRNFCQERMEMRK